MSRHLYIAGVDRVGDLEKGSLRIEQALTYQIDTCSFSVKGDPPVEGEEVIVEDDELGRLFAGIIVKVELARTFPDKSIKVWNVDCDDYTALLDRRLVVEAYENMSASDIFLDIVAKYCPSFTTNGVRPGAPVIESTGAEFEYKRPSECFKWLCDYVGWHWQPDYYKDLHFFSTEELASPAPMVLRPGGKFRFGKHTIDTQGLRNRVYVRGGTMLSDPQVIQWKADGVARIWTLPWPPHEVSFKVGEVPMTVGVENLHDEADFDYMMSFTEKYIRCSSHTPTPVAGITMSLTARQDIPVITMVEDYASQAAIAKVQGGDGVYEHVIDDDSLTTIQAAEAAGMADLREHANPRVKGSFETEYTKPPELTPTALSYTESGEDLSAGTLHQVTTDGNDLVLDQHEVEGAAPTALDYTESGEDFEEGELDGVVVGEDGLTLNLKIYSTNFSEYQTDTSPSGWESDDEDVGWKIIADAGAEGGKYLRGISSSTIKNASLYWEEIGQFQDVEILAKIRTSGNTGTNRADVGVQFRGDKDNPGRKCSFHLMRYEGSNNRVALSKIDATGDIYATFNWSVDTWYMMRVLAIGNKIKCKVWQHGTVEPENWIIDVTDDTYTEGYVGVGSRQMSIGTEMRWDEFQVSTINLQGSRISPPLDLSGVGTVKTSEISWQATEPEGTGITIETAVTGETSYTNENIGTGDGEENTFYLPAYPAERHDDLVIKIDGTAVTEYTREGKIITFNEGHEPDDTLAVTATYTGVANPSETDWEEQTSGEAITNSLSGDSTGKHLWVRETLETEDTSVTPLLSSLNINLTGEKTVMIQVYYDDGYRLSPVIDLSSIAKAKSSELTYSATIPTGTSIKIETSLSTDGGTTYGAWQQTTNGGSIPGIVADMDLSNAKLKTRVTLETEDTSVTPALNNLTINLTGEKLEPRIWQPGQIVDIRLPDRGVEGEYLIQRVTITPTWSNPSIWTYRVEYGGRLLGIADFLKALVSAQQKKRVIEPTKNVQKYIYGEETLTVGDELITATRGLPFVCGDADAICGMVVVSSG